MPAQKRATQAKAKTLRIIICISARKKERERERKGEMNERGALRASGS